MGDVGRIFLFFVQAEKIKNCERKRVWVAYSGKKQKCMKGFGKRVRQKGKKLGTRKGFFFKEEYKTKSHTIII